MPTCDNKLAKDMSANEIHESTKKKCCKWPEKKGSVRLY